MPVDEAGVADVVGAASLLVSETALPSLITRATRAATTKSEMNPTNPPHTTA
jgi:hypothetical protein